MDAESDLIDDAPDSHLRVRLAQGGAILFEPAGFRLIATRGLKRSPLRAYEAISHVYVTDRVFLIGTTAGLLSVRIRDFMDPIEGPVRARQELLGRVADRPDGIAHLEEIEAVDQLGNRNGPVWAIWATVALCLIGTAFQLADPLFQQVTAFMPELFGRGEYWRAITAHFIHDFSPVPQVLQPIFPSLPFIPFHLAINVGGLFVLGHLVERPLGSWRTALVITLSGAGTVLGIVLAGHVEVIGSSGLVAGLAGAMLALELHHPEALPAFWRLPRRLFITAIVLQFGVIDQLLSSYLAGGAHLGGFAGGYGAIRLLGSPSLEKLEPSTPLKFATVCAASLVAMGFVGVAPLARHDMGALERHAFRLLNAPNAVYLYRHDNAAAWLIATEGDASDQGLEMAVALADRAVETTGRIHPGVLDTLAETLFQSGDRLGALLTIEEAIRLQPTDPYFFEQRRRFTGERASEDRPPPPGSPAEDDRSFDDDFEGLPVQLDSPRVTI